MTGSPLNISTFSKEPEPWSGSSSKAQEISTDVYRTVNYSNSRIFGNSEEIKVQPLLLLPAKWWDVRIWYKRCYHLKVPLPDAPSAEVLWGERILAFQTCLRTFITHSEKINLKSKYSRVWRQLLCPISQCKITRTCWLLLMTVENAGAWPYSVAAPSPACHWLQNCVLSRALEELDFT